MNEYRIDVKVRNNVILYKIEKAGYKTLGEFCRLNNIMKYASQIGGVINMKESPLQSDGQFRKSIIKVSELLNCDPLDLFTDTQLQTILKTNKRSIEVNEAEMKFMLENNNNQKLLEDIIQQEKLESLTKETLDTLTTREKKIIEMRFGIIDGKEYTLEECGKELGISAPRSRQLEQKALRKLRYPSRSDDLKEFIES